MSHVLNSMIDQLVKRIKIETEMQILLPISMCWIKWMINWYRIRVFLDQSRKNLYAREPV